MKKILFVAASAILLAAGCQKTEILNQAAGDPMTFSTEMSKLTKAEPTEGDLNLRTQGFKVWAFAAYTDVINNIKPGSVHDGMEAIPVTYKDKDNAWTTDLEYFWPSNENNLDFFALSTKVANTVTIEGEGGNLGGRSMKVAGYTVDPTAANDDLMVAQFIRQNSSMNGKKVELHFKHALSKVVFKFITNPTAVGETPATVVVKSLSIADLVTAGDLNVTESDNATPDATTGNVTVSLLWTPTETAKGNFADDHEDITLTTEPQTIATWLVIPQKLTDAEYTTDKTKCRKATIEYTINNKPFNYTFNLPQGDVDSWGYNQIITYTINLSPNKITFTPVVDDWTNTEIPEIAN